MFELVRVVAMYSMTVVVQRRYAVVAGGLGRGARMALDVQGKRRTLADKLRSDDGDKITNWIIVAARPAQYYVFAHWTGGEPRMSLGCERRCRRKLGCFLLETSYRLPHTLCKAGASGSTDNRSL